MEFTKKCEICQKTANNLCFKCNGYFCNSCFKFIHDKPVNREHKKESIAPFVSLDTKCKIHPQFPLILYYIDKNGKI